MISSTLTIGDAIAAMSPQVVDLTGTGSKAHVVVNLGSVDPWTSLALSYPNIF
jgi:hypothetical protein